MLAIIVPAVASVLVALTGVIGVLVGTRNGRQVLLADQEILTKLTPGTLPYNQQQNLINHRIYLWHLKATRRVTLVPFVISITVALVLSSISFGLAYTQGFDVRIIFRENARWFVFVLSALSTTMLLLAIISLALHAYAVVRDILKGERLPDSPKPRPARSSQDASPE